MADVLATVVVFVASRVHRNSSFYDAYWSVLPPYLVGYWWWAGPRGLDDPWAWLVVVVVGFWAVRLTANWVRTFPGMHHEDWRYPMLRERAGRWELVVDFVAIPLVPTLQVFLGTVPAYLLLTDDATPVGLVGLASDPDAWWVLAGTVAMTAMFLGASIPMMEARSLERRPGYQDVIDRVPRLLPRRLLRRS